jgi:hypothetical protein
MEMSTRADRLSMDEELFMIPSWRLHLGGVYM